jgi:XTP/dITP diphosphohydrolase
MKILLASNNAKKRRELERVLGKAEGLAVQVQVFVPSDVGLAIDPDETGTTFAANARIKALAFAAASDLLVLADDSGLCVDALDGAPGVRSARYAGPAATDADNRAKLLAALAGVPPERRTAAFRCALCLVRGDEVLAEVEGRCEGRILDVERGEGGFGYDPLFVPAGGDATFAELDDSTKDRVSHRGIALRALIPHLRPIAS